jgi:hypothetical protein
MGTVRKKLTGTYIHASGTWRVKEKKDKEGRTIRPNLALSVRQLSKLFGVDIPRSEEESKPYWMKFLKAYANYTAKKQGQQSPLQERIRSLEVLIQQFGDENRPAEVVAMLERELAEARAVPPHDIDHTDGPTIHPDVRPQAELLETAGHLDDFTARLLNTMAPKPIPKEQSLRQQIDAFIERDRLHSLAMKAKGRSGKGWYSTRTYLTTFAGFAGNIRLDAIDNALYQDYLRHLEETISNRTTRSNYQICLHTFLKEMEALDGKLNFGFMRVKKNQIGRPDGEKETWTLEQVNTALQHATGDARILLMLGLNFGWHISDYMNYIRSKNAIVDGHITQARIKNDRQDYDFEGTWLVWDETADVLVARPKTALYEAFKELRKQHGLPDQKALRKTVANIIEGAIQKAGGEQVARLYRCERSPDNHGKYYSKFTPEQVANLDKALRFVRQKLFG